MPKLPHVLFTAATSFHNNGVKVFPWKDIDQTPALFHTQLENPGPFWPEAPGTLYGNIAAALRANFQTIRKEFLAALPNLEIIPGRSDGDRPEWVVVPVKNECKLMPTTCSVVGQFYPFSRLPWAA